MFIVVELQTNENGQIAPLVYGPYEGPQAEQKYHTVLAAAAVSNVHKHSAAILNDAGERMTSQCYFHGSTENDSEEEI